MQKRATLISAAAKAMDNLASAPTEATPRPRKSSLTTTAISIQSETLRLLNRVASARQDENGGRKSVSAVIERLVQQHRAELEAELKRYKDAL